MCLEFYLWPITFFCYCSISKFISIAKTVSQRAKFHRFFQIESRRGNKNSYNTKDEPICYYPLKMPFSGSGWLLVVGVAWAQFLSFLCRQYRSGFCPSSFKEHMQNTGATFAVCCLWFVVSHWSRLHHMSSCPSCSIWKHFSAFAKIVIAIITVSFKAQLCQQRAQNNMTRTTITQSFSKIVVYYYYHHHWFTTKATSTYKQH